MTKEVVIQLRDDLSKKLADDVSTREFTIDGVAYETELSDENYAKFQKAVARFVAAARVKKKTRKKPPPQRQGDVRQWAVAAGYEVAARGALPAEVIEAYRLHKSEG